MIRSTVPAQPPPRRWAREAASRLAMALLALSFLLFSVLLKAELRRDSADGRGPSPGETVPPLKLPSIEGDSVDLAEVLARHRLVAVVFWASWCPPCRVELHRLADLDRELGDRFTVIAVSLDVDRNAVERELADRALPFPVLLDPERRMAERFAVETLPTTFLIGSEGEVRQVHKGFSGSLPTQVTRLAGADGA